MDAADFAHAKGEDPSLGSNNSLSGPLLRSEGGGSGGFSARAALSSLRAAVFGSEEPPPARSFFPRAR